MLDNQYLLIIGYINKIFLSIYIIWEFSVYDRCFSGFIICWWN